MATLHHSSVFLRSLHLVAELAYWKQSASVSSDGSAKPVATSDSCSLAAEATTGSTVFFKARAKVAVPAC